VVPQAIATSAEATTARIPTKGWLERFIDAHSVPTDAERRTAMSPGWRDGELAPFRGVDGSHGKPRARSPVLANRALRVDERRVEWLPGVTRSAPRRRMLRTTASFGAPRARAERPDLRHLAVPSWAHGVLQVDGEEPRRWRGYRNVIAGEAAEVEGSGEGSPWRGGGDGWVSRGL
jgi:hypothetical protein